MEKALSPKIEISLKTIVIGIISLVLLRFAWDMKDLLLSLFIAYIAMSAAKEPVDYLSKKGLSRGLAVLFVFLLFFAAVVFLFSWIIPPFVSETVLFIDHFPRILETVKRSLPISVGNISLSQYIPSATDNFISVIGSVFSNAAFILSTIFFSVYLTLDAHVIEGVFSRFVSKERLERILKIEGKIEKRLGRWLLGQFLLMTIIGVTTYVGLLLLGVRYALPLGIIAGILEAVPNIGPTLAAVPAFFVGFSQYPLLGLFTILMAVVVQQLENHLIVPLVMKKVVGLHPVLTLIVLLIGGKYAGVAGLLFAIPLALVIETIVSGLKD